MDYSNRAVFLSAISKPWEIDGRKGVTHRVRVLMSGYIFKMNATEDMVKEIAPLIGDDKKNKDSLGLVATIDYTMTSRDEDAVFTLNSYALATAPKTK